MTEPENMNVRHIYTALSAGFAQANNKNIFSASKLFGYGTTVVGHGAVILPNMMRSSARLAQIIIAASLPKCNTFAAEIAAPECNSLFIYL